MAKQTENNIKLGVFVLVGLLAMMLAFYLIGNNSSMFKSSFILKSRFNNLDGLKEGNNVLFSGMQSGTVKSITIINDTTIEVAMLIDTKIQAFIHSTALAAIGTEGLMGNKVVNIQPAKQIGVAVKDGDFLAPKRFTSMDQMMETLSKTNSNVATISEALKTSVLKLDTSEVLNLLNDKEIGISIKSSLKNINAASNNASNMTATLDMVARQIKQGKGAAGLLLTDTAFEGNLKTSMLKIKAAADNVNKASVQLNSMTANINHDIADGKGPLHAVLRDTAISQKINASITNLQKGSEGFTQIVEALKHNFLVRGYFRRQGKTQKKDSLNKLSSN